MPLNFLDAKSSIFAGVNPFEVSDYVKRNVGGHSLRLARSSSGTASLNHRKAGSVDLCRLSYGTEARVLSEGLADAEGRRRADCEQQHRRHRRPSHCQRSQPLWLCPCVTAEAT